MDRVKRLAAKVGRVLHRSIDDMVVQRSVLTPMADLDRRKECAGVRIECATASNLITVPNVIPRLRDSFALVAFDRSTGELCGYCWCTGAFRAGEGVPPFLYDIRPKAGSAYIYDLYVKPTHRQHGLATILMDCTVAEAGERGFAVVFYTLDRSSAPMIALSARLGFEVVGTLSFRRVMGVKRVDLSALGGVCELKS